jgi:hypothetical protein
VRRCGARILSAATEPAVLFGACKAGNGDMVRFLAGMAPMPTRA